MSAVKVAVRVRPFNQREEDIGSVCCISMRGKETHLLDIEDSSSSSSSSSSSNSKPPRIFCFDYSYWSHDGYKEREDGYKYPEEGSNYADQSLVYRQLGEEVLINALEGFHTCLFAYGQTGAGKSYSMVGYGANKGIVPLVCENIFNKIKDNTEKDKSFHLSVSMLEVYNELVQDLLIKPTERPKAGLSIRYCKP